MSKVKVITVPAFSDNYLWLFHGQQSRKSYVVDPGDPKPILKALDEHNLDLAGILITHHHPDHTGGIDTLLNHASVPVYGPGGGSVPQVDHPLSHGDQINLEAGIGFQILEVPGHTLDHIAYFSSADKILFCGDTLFAGGCGRLFEGTAAQMHQSLQRLAQLPGDTQVYCAHEYTLANLAFAKAVEPGNADLINRITHESQRRQSNIPTVPTTIATELATNPFLRCHIAAVKQAARDQCGKDLPSTETVLGAVRAWKDNF